MSIRAIEPRAPRIELGRVGVTQPSNLFGVYARSRELCIG